MLHIIYGKDALGRKEAFEKLRAELDKDGSLATSTVTLEAKSTSPQEVMAACDTIPFFGDARLVVVEGVLRTAARLKPGTNARNRGASTDNLGSKAADPDISGAREDWQQNGEETTGEIDPGVWLVLAEYVPRMPSSTTLVLLDADATAANPLLRKLGPLGRVDHFPEPNERELPGWVLAKAKKIGLKLDGPAAKLLADLIGPDGWMLSTEMDKLLAYSSGEVVRVSDVRELVGRAKEHKGWDLTDAIVDGQGATAARVLSEMLEDGQHTQLILGIIAGRYRRVAIVRDMLDSGESGSAIAARVKVKVGYPLDRLIEQAERLPLPAIRAAYTRLIEADLDVKRGLMEDDRLAVELAVQDLASRPTVARR